MKSQHHGFSGQQNFEELKKANDECSTLQTTNFDFLRFMDSLIHLCVL
jgi:hypothetical protein